MKINKFDEFQTNESSNSAYLVELWNEYIKMVTIMDDILNDEGELRTSYWKTEVQPTMDKLTAEIEPLVNTGNEVSYIAKHQSEIVQNFRDMCDGLDGYLMAGHTIDQARLLKTIRKKFIK